MSVSEALGGASLVRRVRRVFYVLLAPILAVVLGSAPNIEEERIGQIVAPYAWSIWSWEAQNIVQGLRLLGLEATTGQQKAPPSRFESFLSNPHSIQDDETRALLLVSAISAQLRGQDVATMGPVVFPPVTMAVGDLPRALVVSPRDEIRVRSFVLLDSDLDLAATEALERSVERLNLSALVVDIGGIATYPPLIPRDLPPLVAIETAAHEWTHNALFLMPLGLAYERSAEARAINETAADLVGGEIASAIASRFEIAPRLDAGGGRARQLREALQRVRTVVDQMLARGEVEEAEAFMEAERRSLVEQGFTSRRLNQAYFAFNGNYAQGPVRSREIPDGVLALRARSASLGDFVRRVGKITSAEELSRAAYG